MRRVAFLLYPGYSVMALAVVTVFETANMLEEHPLYSSPNEAGLSRPHRE